MRAATAHPPGATRRRRRLPFELDDDGRQRRPRAPVPVPTARVAAAASSSSSSSCSVPQWLDNAAAQSAAALDVEYAHYELYKDEDERPKRRQSRPLAVVSVPAAVAVVARGEGEAFPPPPRDWRSGLEVLYHAPYIEPELTVVQPEGSWKWVGGVKRPVPSSSPFDQQTTTLTSARSNVLTALSNRSCIVLHGADHDLRALGLLTLSELSSILDTAALPPLTHPRSGGPVSLKRLARRFLGRDIQLEGELHDPVEDAAAALDLWLDVAWPRALVDRQVVGGGVGGGGGGEAGAAALSSSSSPSSSSSSMLVAALEATLAREVAQGRRRKGVKEKKKT